MTDFEALTRAQRESKVRRVLPWEAEARAELERQLQELGAGMIDFLTKRRLDRWTPVWTKDTLVRWVFPARRLFRSEKPPERTILGEQVDALPIDHNVFLTRDGRWITANWKTFFQTTGDWGRPTHELLTEGVGVSDCFVSQEDGSLIAGFPESRVGREDSNWVLTMPSGGQVGEKGLSGFYTLESVLAERLTRLTE